MLFELAALDLAEMDALDRAAKVEVENDTEVPAIRDEQAGRQRTEVERRFTRGEFHVGRCVGSVVA